MLPLILVCMLLYQHNSDLPIFLGKSKHLFKSLLPQGKAENHIGNDKFIFQTPIKNNRDSSPQSSVKRGLTSNHSYHKETKQKNELSPLLVSPDRYNTRNIFKRDLIRKSPLHRPSTHNSSLNTPRHTEYRYGTPLAKIFNSHNDKTLGKSSMTLSQYYAKLQDPTYPLDRVYETPRRKKRIVNKADETLMNLVYLEEHYLRSKKGVLDLRDMVRKFKTKPEDDDIVTAEHEPITPLDNKEKERLNKIFGQSGVVGELGNIELTVEDINLLKYSRWLNDECVNFYMEYLYMRSKKNKDLPQCHFFNSFFYMFLFTKNGYNYAKVRNWTKRVDIFSFNKIIIPVHLGNHWTLGVVNFDKKRFEYYDSLGDDSTPFFEVMRKYLNDEHNFRKKEDYDLSEWVDFIPQDIPHQQNGYDCGVFACKYADYCSRNKPFDFRQVDMPTIRKRIILDMLS